MRFCPQCGHRLGERDYEGRIRPACESCGFVHMGAWTVGVGGVVVNEGKVLLARRSIPPAAGAWAIPGGYVESDELLEDAVVREVREETGVEAEVRSLVSVRSVVRPSRLDTYVVFHLACVQGEAVADGHENDHVGWFSAAELNALEGLTPFSMSIARAVLNEKQGLHRVPYERPGGEPADCFGIQ
jgi:ADP-ribose pyrophosphatase YjhB (NUDIX family)